MLNQEKLILGVTEALSEAIEKRGLTRSEVAKRLSKTKGFVSQLLAGGRNLTLRTVADIADAIGISLKVAVQGAEISKSDASATHVPIGYMTVRFLAKGSHARRTAVTRSAPHKETRRPR